MLPFRTNTVETGKTCLDGMLAQLANKKF
ncbi:hypothetical protein Bhyg_05744 [Pseudolycoriella hygida]|uniref:Uncharacterized protein n=1 Tax=Pseudolycoriella hygida TaxID=35572 RepID=A0A9Q0S0A9_9DIPT|nr:hypothetical protein Bhyg_05744 [Pseudolycoriella hygida]